MLEKVIAKLAKIRAHAESAKAIGSEAEALHFANMLNDLLTKHNLEMTDIEWEEEIKDEPVEEVVPGGGTEWKGGKRFYKEYPDVEIKNKRIQWSENLAGIIARAHSCQILVSQSSSWITFVGRKSNIAIVEYMYISMLRAIKKIAQQEYNKKRNRIQKEIEQGLAYDYDEISGYRESWRNGFIDSLSAMFREEAEKLKVNEAAGTALMRIDKDKIAVRSYIDENYGRKANSLSRGSNYNRAGYREGGAKARELGIKKGVGTSAGSKQIN